MKNTTQGEALQGSSQLQIHTSHVRTIHQSLALALGKCKPTGFPIVTSLSAYTTNPNPSSFSSSFPRLAGQSNSAVWQDLYRATRLDTGCIW